MIIPIRCFSCGKPIAHLYAQYKTLVEEGATQKEALDKYGAEGSGKNLPFSSLSEDLKKKGKDKKED